MTSLNLLPNIENNLEKFEDDVVYLKHQQKIHIFPVDSVHVEENSAFSSSTETEKGIYLSSIQQSVLKWMQESTNLCVFTGGQTFSGKEEWMFGDRLKGSIIYYTLDSIFNYIETDSSREFIVRVSCFEIYNETVDDLLSISTNTSKDKTKNADKLIEEVWTTYNEVIALWNMSLNNKINLNSSRKKEFYQNKKKNQFHVS